jgi:hypothetical protein
MRQEKRSGNERGREEKTGPPKPESLNPVTFPVLLNVQRGAPLVDIKIEGKVRKFIVDTESSLCLIQPDISRVAIQATETAAMGITGNALSLVGEQIVEFTLDNRLFRQKFGVCTLPTEADGLLGLNFLSTHGVRLDLASNKLEVQSEALAKHVKESQVETAFTFFPAAEGHYGQSSELLGEKANRIGQKPVKVQSAPENEILNPESWVVKLPKTINTMETGDADLRHLRFCVINVKDG